METAAREPLESRSSEPTASSGPGKPELVLAGLFLPTVIFLLKANNIVLQNLQDLGYSLLATLLFLGGFAACATMTVPLFLHASRRRWCAGAARVGLGLGLAVLLWSLVDTLTRYRVRGFALTVALDEAVLLAAAVACLRVRWGLLVRLAAAVSAALLVHGLAAHAGAVVPHVQRQRAARGEGRAGQTAAVGLPARPRPTGNVYHLMLDGFQREAFEILRDRDVTLHPPGFTYYADFIVGYFLTTNSMASILTGRYWTLGQDHRAWLREATDGGLWRDLATNGVAVTLYPYLGQRDCSPYAAGGCRPPDDLFQGSRLTWMRLSATADLLDFWFSSLPPKSVRAYVTRAYLHDEGALEHAPGAEAPALPIGGWIGLRPEGAEAGLGAFGYWTMRNFDRFLEDEARRPPTGQYVFFHALVPHYPYTLDEHCGVRADGGWRTDAYLAQATCALRLVHRLVQRLSELDRLENALIVVHGDHGILPMLIPDFVQRYPERFSPAVVAAVRARLQGLSDAEKLSVYTDDFTLPETAAIRSGALLLVKYPGVGTTGQSFAPARPIDLAPTILVHEGLPTDAYPGSPLQALPESGDRAAVFYVGPKRVAEIHDWQDTTGSAALWAALDRASFTQFERIEGTWTRTDELPVD